MRRLKPGTLLLHPNGQHSIVYEHRYNMVRTREVRKDGFSWIAFGRFYDSPASEVRWQVDQGRWRIVTVLKRKQVEEVRTPS